MVLKKEGDEELLLTATSATTLRLKTANTDTEQTFDDVLGFKAFPFENEEVVESRKSLSPASKYGELHIFTG